MITAYKLPISVSIVVAITLVVCLIQILMQAQRIKDYHGWIAAVSGGVLTWQFLLKQGMAANWAATCGFGSILFLLLAILVARENGNKGRKGIRER